MEEITDHSAVIEQVDKSTLRVKPYGNCSFFNSQISFGNIGVYDNGDLRVNLL